MRILASALFVIASVGTAAGQSVKTYDYSATTRVQVHDGLNAPVTIPWLPPVPHGDDPALVRCEQLETALASARRDRPLAEALAGEHALERCLDELVASIPPPEVDLRASLRLARFHASVASVERRDLARANAILARVAAAYPDRLAALGFTPPADPCAPQPAASADVRQLLAYRCGWRALGDQRPADAVAVFRGAANDGPDPLVAAAAVRGWASAAGGIAGDTLQAFVDFADVTEHGMRERLASRALAAHGNVVAALPLVAHQLGLRPTGATARCELQSAVLQLHETLLDRTASVAALESSVADIRRARQLGASDTSACEVRVVAFVGALAEAWHVESEHTRDPAISDAALHAYRTFLDLAPDGPESYNVTYYLAELEWARAEADRTDWPSVVDAFDRVVARAPVASKAPEAIYAMLLALQNSANKAPDHQLAAADRARMQHVIDDLPYLPATGENSHHHIAIGAAMVLANGGDPIGARPLIEAELTELDDDNRAVAGTVLGGLVRVGAWQDARSLIGHHAALGALGVPVALLEIIVDAKGCEADADRPHAAACYRTLAKDHAATAYANRALALAAELTR